MFSVSFLHLNHTRIRIQFQCNALNCRKTFFSFSIFTYLSKTHTTVLGASLNLPNTFFTNSSSFPSSANSTCATSFSNIFKFGDFRNRTFFWSLMSSSCAFGSSRSFLNASIADTNLHFFKYSSARGITTSQIKVHPATKNG